MRFRLLEAVRHKSPEAAESLREAARRLVGPNSRFHDQERHAINRIVLQAIPNGTLCRQPVAPDIAHWPLLQSKTHVR